MNVDSIISQIAYLSLNEDAPDAAMQTRILAYVNNAYKEAYRLSAALNKHNVMTTEDVSVTSGAGTITADFLRIEQVVDTGQEVVLAPSDVLEVERMDEGLDDTGNPSHYYMTSETAINTYPKDTTTLRVRGIPNPSDLAVGGTEATILLPKAYHDLLVDGGLFYMYQDERDVRTVAEINAAKTVFEIKMNDMKRHLMSQQNKRKRTRGIYF